MQIETNQVYTLKITNGEEIVVRITNAEHQDYLEVSHPVSVAPGPQGLGLVPSLFTVDHAHPITINKSNIVMYGLTDDSVRVKYIEATTGLRVPEKKILMS